MMKSMVSLFFYFLSYILILSIEQLCEVIPIEGTNQIRIIFTPEKLEDKYTIKIIHDHHTYPPIIIDTRISHIEHGKKQK